MMSQMNPLQSGLLAASPMTVGSPPQAMPPPAQAAGLHQQIGQAIAGLNMTPEEMEKEAKLATFASAALGKLAKDPNIKPRDIIKVASDAVAKNLETPAKAIAFLTRMPNDDTKLHQWAQAQAGMFMTTAVHLKAQMIRAAQPAPVAPIAAAPPPGVPQ